MSGGAGESTEAAPVMTANFEHEEGYLLRELVVDREAGWEWGGIHTVCEVKELESRVMGVMEGEEESGRPGLRARWALRDTVAEHAGISPARQRRRLRRARQRLRHLRDTEKADHEGSTRALPRCGGTQEPTAGWNGADPESRRGFEEGWKGVMQSGGRNGSDGG